MCKETEAKKLEKAVEKIAEITAEIMAEIMSEERRLLVKEKFPRFCFSCGCRLGEPGFAQFNCLSLQCGGSFISSVDESGNMVLTLVQL